MFSPLYLHDFHMYMLLWMRQRSVALTHTLWSVKMYACGDSLCLSDGCEGQSLLAMSQNGLSLSLASLFSGICGLEWWAWLHSYLQAVYCGCAPLRGSWWFYSKLKNLLSLIAVTAGCGSCIIAVLVSVLVS